MEDLYLLLSEYVGDSQKALDVLADTLDNNRDKYSINDVISALRYYQGQQLIHLAAAIERDDADVLGSSVRKNREEIRELVRLIDEEAD